MLAVFLISAYPANAGIGMGEWQIKTPGGNTMDNYSGTEFSLVLSDSSKTERVEDLVEWYFYKESIIGKQGKGFFIAYEKQVKVYNYKDEKAWRAAIAAKGLDPIIWTRWHKDKWNFFDGNFDMYLLYYWPIMLFVAIVLIVIIFNVIKQERLNLRKPTTIGMLAMILGIAIYCLLQVCPQSL